MTALFFGAVIIGIPLVYFFRENGVVPSLIVSSPGDGDPYFLVV